MYVHLLITEITDVSLPFHSAPLLLHHTTMTIKQYNHSLTPHLLNTQIHNSTVVEITTLNYHSRLGFPDKFSLHHGRVYSYLPR